ncbi:hypothetical protein H4696_002401 [Amycolatopsis lexingtonensis]|uniref:Uncharacterized protein n=1 Tax=Amycolatopsis lexingtonensis TaxID=218822 RepID=A0ABR9HWI3_9PSEU|nr:hypothetical protein [Amycolatopsis lexingtonensis]MBE1495301.1 hypothetical protein [Amycolatopsis lexingtonensis]
MFFRRARHRARLSAVADRIGARNGVVLNDYFSGGSGANGPLVLGVITLRDGDPAEVLRTLVDDAAAGGYPVRPRRIEANGCGFTRVPGLPMLVIETFAAGKVIPWHGEVPPGKTGVVVSLT